MPPKESEITAPASFTSVPPHLALKQGSLEQHGQRWCSHDVWIDEPVLREQLLSPAMWAGAKTRYGAKLAERDEVHVKCPVFSCRLEVMGFDAKERPLFAVREWHDYEKAGETFSVKLGAIEIRKTSPHRFGLFREGKPIAGEQALTFETAREKSLQDYRAIA
jgi:hypothetical protein